MRALAPLEIRPRIVQASRRQEIGITNAKQTPPSLTGFSLIELLIAITILTSTLVAVSLAAFGTPDMLARGAREAQAVRDANTLLDKETHLAESGFSSIVSIATSTDSSGSDIALVVSSLPDEFTKRATAIVSWTEPFHPRATISLTRILTDPANAINADPCDVLLLGSWNAPVSHSFTLSPGDLLPAATATGVRTISSVTTYTGMLAVTLDPAASKTDSSLYLFRTGSTTPTYAGSIDNATTTKAGITAVALKFPYLYAASTGSANWNTCAGGPACAQIDIFDVSIPASPKLAGTFTFGTTSAPFALGSGGQSVGKSITYHNGYLYIGLTKTGSAQGEEFNIVDVQDSLHPIWRGGVSIGRTVNRILIQGTRAYLATDDNARELVIVDIKSPTTPTILGVWNAPGASSFGYGNVFVAASSILYLGRSYVSNAPELNVLDVTDPTQVIATTNLDVGTALNPLSVVGITLRDQLLTLLTTNNLQFIHTPIAGTPASFTESIPLPLGNTAVGLTCARNTLFAGMNDTSSNGTIMTVTSS